VKTHKLSCRNVVATVAPVDGRLGLRVIGDRGSLEVFANQGQAAISVGYAPADGDRGFSIMAEGGEATLINPQFGDLKTP
jgi:sucrose-6-phosphate hydrolase SacC (GH32 family)